MFYRVLFLVLLLPALALSSSSVQDKENTPSERWTGDPLSFDFKDIDIKDLFLVIADISGMNVMVDPAVKGTVTLKLKDVPWDQALDVITKNQGLGYTIEGNVIRVAPLSKFVQEARARQEAENQQALSGELVTKIIPLSYAKAVDVEKIVRRLLTTRGSVVADARSNILIITDTGENIDAITRLIGK